MEIFDIPRNALIVADRIFVPLRKAGGISTGNPLYHAVTPYCRIALCSTEPGVRSGWAEPPAAGGQSNGMLSAAARAGGQLSPDRVDNSVDDPFTDPGGWLETPPATECSDFGQWGNPQMYQAIYLLGCDRKRKTEIESQY